MQVLRGTKSSLYSVCTVRRPNINLSTNGFIKITALSVIPERCTQLCQRVPVNLIYAQDKYSLLERDFFSLCSPYVGSLVVMWDLDWCLHVNTRWNLLQGIFFLLVCSFVTPPTVTCHFALLLVFSLCSSEWWGLIGMDLILGINIAVLSIAVKQQHQRYLCKIKHPMS